MESRISQLEQDIAALRGEMERGGSAAALAKLSRLESVLSGLHSNDKQLESEPASSCDLTHTSGDGIRVYGRVTGHISGLFQTARKQKLLAPSPLEVLHGVQCDGHVIGKSNLYRSTGAEKMLRSKSQVSQQDKNPLIETVLKLGDILTNYGQLTGYKMLIPLSKTVNQPQIYELLTKMVPRHCMGITLDCVEAQKLLEDAGVVPQAVSVLRYQILFQRATYLQTKLLQTHTLQIQGSAVSDIYRLQAGAANQAPDLQGFNYNAIKKLAYPGFVFLVYTIAEHLAAQEDDEQPQSLQNKSLANPYASYRYSAEIADPQRYKAYKKSWLLMQHFGALLDCKILPKCQKAHMLAPQPMMTPDLRQFPQALQVFSKHVQLIRDIFEWTATKNSQALITPQTLYLICTRADIHEQLSKDFCFRLVMILYSQIDVQTFVPGLTQDEFLTAIFVCANCALCREPFVQKLRRPEDRLSQVLERLRSINWALGQ